MNLGPSEIIIVSIIAVIFVVSVVLPIYAAIKAFSDGESGWGIGILVGMFIPFGAVIGLVYLVRRREQIE
jgi:uncharacterized membrane protein HdeD (DUF308 family)